MTGFEDEYRVYEFGKDEFVRLEKEYAEKMGLREVSEEEQKDTSFLYVDEFISFFTNPPSECAGTPTGYLGSWNYPDIMKSFRNKVARASAALYGFGCRPNGRKPVWAEMRDKYFNGKPYVDPDEMIGYLEGTLRKVTNSIALYGKDQEVEYECIYAGYKYVFVESDQVGCALVTVPAVYLAQNVLPEGMDAFSLHGLPLVEWEKKLDLKELTFME